MEKHQHDDLELLQFLHVTKSRHLNLNVLLKENLSAKNEALPNVSLEEKKPDSEDQELKD